MISANASASNAASTAALVQPHAAALNAQAESSLATAAYHKQKTETEAASALTKQELTQAKIDAATAASLKISPQMAYISKVEDSLKGNMMIPPGSPEANMYSQWIQDSITIATENAKNKNKPGYVDKPLPPLPTQVEKVTPGFFGSSKTKEWQYGGPKQTTESPSMPPKPSAYPDAKLGKDPQGNPAWYIQKDGQYYKVQ
jgi:hypothetical protein